MDKKSVGVVYRIEGTGDVRTILGYPSSVDIPIAVAHLSLAERRIFGVMVDSEWPHYDIATQLVGRLCNIATDHLLPMVWAGIAPENETANKLFCAAGFHEESIWVKRLWVKRLGVSAHSLSSASFPTGTGDGESRAIFSRYRADVHIPGRLQ